MIRVGFALTVAEKAWQGGVSYFRNLFRALASLPDARLEPVLIARRDAPSALTDGLGASTVLRSPWVEVESLRWRVRRTCQLYLGRDLPFERYLRYHRIDVLSHSGNLGPLCSIPTLAWIPDLQERHYPEFFDPEEYSLRIRNETEQCARASRVLVSSETARRDLERVDAGCGGSAPVLRFVADIPELSRLPSRPELESRYGFDGPYFHLPNQFWLHKNHALVVEALARLAAARRRVLVLATGNTNDYRRPDHFPRLMQRVREAGVEAMFRPLGMVPYDDLMALMFNSAAVINPSLFEGWSTSVEEARSMGRVALLSDIPTHREQAPARGRYFQTDDPQALADLMWEAWTGIDETEERRAEEAARADLPVRRAAFARGYEEIVLALLAGYARRRRAC
jgi:glycosyltransferase involved in cell wall biosynthesis